MIYPTKETARSPGSDSPTRRSPHARHPSTNDRPLKIGSLFSGYRGLDLAADGRTVWFSELMKPIARVFSHHWPDAPNLGDITAVRWNKVEPVDVLCGGFPCQDISNVSKGAGLAPRHPLRPLVVHGDRDRGTATHPQRQGTVEDRNPDNATPAPATLRDLEPGDRLLGDEPVRPLRALGVRAL